MSGNQDYARNHFGPNKFGSLSWVFIQAAITDGSGAVERDATNSSPETTIARDAAGTYSVTFPGGEFAQVVGAEVLLAENAGSKLYPEALDADAGTATFEAATAPGTAADPAVNSRLFITILVGRN